ncbi:MAG: ArsB/NhaD family transporter [Anaerolineaceae bacterium]|nr:ArsB/NhaD family transporter [Anaerolineaceae bacterium]MBN2677321.1 ArsB/NhaD family transporter [Anaerolineaceae bacterium]
MTTAAIISTAVFLISLGLIFSEKLHRTIIGFAGAVLMVGVGRWLGFYSESQAIAAIDFETIGLLAGMMILVSLLEPTGFFQFLAVWAGRLSKGRPVYLLVMLGSVTTIISMFLDNVTTVVMIAPVTILICEVLGINPMPYLIAEALLSDTGGAATLIGDPPNILIGSAAGLTFMDFILKSLPIVLVSWLTALLLLRILFRRELSTRPKNIKAILKLNPQEALDDGVTARRVLIVLGVAILFFFFSHYLAVSPAFIAIAAAAAAMIWVRPNVKDTLMRIEWSVLIFFAGLFVIVGGLNAAGVFDVLVQALAGLHIEQPLLFSILLIWVVAGLSAIVDNVPITIAMIPVIQGLGSTGMNITPLWWALVFGAGFGGNGTIIGSSANIIVACLSEKTRTPITTRLWSKSGLPVMLATCTVASILFAITYSWLSR